MAKISDNVADTGYSSTVRKVQTVDNFTQRIAYNASNLTEYIGLAKPGTATSAASWQIKKLVYSGSLVTEILFADGDTNFDNVWDDRTSLSYS